MFTKNWLFKILGPEYRSVASAFRKCIQKQWKSERMSRVWRQSSHHCYQECPHLKSSLQLALVSLQPARCIIRSYSLLSLYPHIYICSFKLTLFRTEQKPLNWMVAPSTESIRLPHNPANAETGMTKSCFRATSLAHLAVKSPKIRNVTPTVVPAARAAKSPAFVTPPFVPFFTG